MKKWLVICGVLFVLLAGGVGTYFYRREGTSVIKPHRGDITEAVYGLGKVKSHKKFEVIIGIISTVRKLYADEGQEVKAGGPLIRFEDGSDFRAPFDGVVTFVRSREGEIGLPSTPILRLEDLTDRYIELSLEQEAALRIRRGQKARVSFESLRGTVLHGTVASIYSREEEFIAHIRVPDLDPSVLPGMTADVSVEIGKITNAVLIPIRAVSNGLVTVRRNGTWKKLKLDLGHVDGRYIEVLGKQLHENDELRVRKGE